MRLALGAAAVLIAVAGTSTTVAAQRSQPRIAHAAPPPAPPPRSSPYPGATVTIDPRLYQQQPVAPLHRQRQPAVVYVAVPSGYSYYPGYYPGAYPMRGGVNDTNGRPLSASFDAPAPIAVGYGLGTPDLSGVPYVAVEGGAMVVELGDGQTRTVPSCAAQSADRTPDGQPRTVFYQGESGGYVLRAGQRGRVVGEPAEGKQLCYTVDEYGRMALAY
jgi:hypothetical protein